MTNNENQYTIYIRSTKESIPVSKEEFDAYYHDINIYRIRQQRHGRCVCPASKRLTCDMDCLTCPFHRMGDMRSLDHTETDDEGKADPSCTRSASGRNHHRPYLQGHNRR